MFRDKCDYKTERTWRLTEIEAVIIVSTAGHLARLLIIIVLVAVCCCFGCCLHKKLE